MIKNKKIKSNNFIEKSGIIIITILLLFIALTPSVNSINPEPLCKATIGDYVWEDLDINGIQDPDELGIDEVTVELYSNEDVFIDSTETSDGGIYKFTKIEPGCYYIKFILPPSYRFTLQDVGCDDTIDSDADPSSGKTKSTYLCPGEVDLSWDAGLYKKASIGDYVWEDYNKDGIQDPDEPGIDEVTVELYSNEDVFIDSTETSDGGIYEFIDLDPGSYYVKFILPTNYKFTLQDVGCDDTIDSDADPTTGKTICVDLEPGMDLDTLDAGMYLVEYYTLNINIIGGCGHVKKNPDYPYYTTGTIVRLKAYPNVSFFKFSHWSGDLSGNKNPEFITMDSNKTVNAHFTFVEYTLTINIEGNGHVIKDPDQETYRFNDIVILTAVADHGWKFDHWSGDLSGNENPERIMIYYVQNVTAHFTYHEYSLNINIEGNGNVIKDPNYAMFPRGTIVELTAVADPGWKFDHWSGDLSGCNNPEFITMDNNKTVNAYFNKVDPPEIPTINGPERVKVGNENKYKFITTDPNNYKIYYYIDWGDGNFSEWIGPYQSGEKVYISHSWPENKEYTILAKARNEFYAESYWGTFDIIVTKNKAINTPLIKSFLNNYLRLFQFLKILLTQFIT